MGTVVKCLTCTNIYGSQGSMYRGNDYYEVSLSSATSVQLGPASSPLWYCFLVGQMRHSHTCLTKLLWGLEEPIYAKYLMGTPGEDHGTWALLWGITQPDSVCDLLQAETTALHIVSLPVYSNTHSSTVFPFLWMLCSYPLLVFLLGCQGFVFSDGKMEKMIGVHSFIPGVVSGEIC